MKRREFITLLGGAAAVWPFTARAQQSAMPVIGFLHPSSLGARREQIAVFHRGLAEKSHSTRETGGLGPCIRAGERWHDRHRAPGRWEI
jgi:hypothetical protein